MKFLVIGLGSMGKRRIRCLQALGETQLAGHDPRADRRAEAERKYGVSCHADFHEAMRTFQPDALIISVPPAQHHLYVAEATARELPFFVEASVLDTGMREAIAALERSGKVGAASATLWFHPAIQVIRDIVQSGELGRVSNVLLHSGQYLPDWHTYESVADYYVSDPATSGGREIVPFELSWFTRVFGWPIRIAANYRKTLDIPGAPGIDDTYNLLLDYGQSLAVVTVDVVSRYATRRLTVNGSAKQLIWSWDENRVRIFDPALGRWEDRGYGMDAAEPGYNANIGENMYIEEIRSFLAAIGGGPAYFNSLADDLRVLELLYLAERAEVSSTFQEVGR